jgi:hypothetical protein
MQDFLFLCAAMLDPDFKPNLSFIDGAIGDHRDTA